MLNRCRGPPRVGVSRKSLGGPPSWGTPLTKNPQGRPMSYDLYCPPARENEPTDDDGIPPGIHEGDAPAFLRRHRRECSGSDLRNRHVRRIIARKVIRRIADTRNLWLAALHLCRGGTKAAGPNGQRLTHLLRQNPRRVRNELRTLSQQVTEGTYVPGPVRKVKIPKASGKGTRTIEVANWQDQVVQRAIAQVLEPILDPTFSGKSFGFRPGRGRESAIAWAVRWMETTGMHTVIAADVRNAFDNLVHKELLQRVQHAFGSRPLTRLIKRIIQSNERKKGIAQGGCLSPLLLNLVLDAVVDKKWERQHPQTPLIRYADDVLVICRNEEEAAQAYVNLQNLLRPVGLSVKGSPSSDIKDTSVEPVEWLGYAMRYGRKRVTTRTGKDLQKRIHQRLKQCLEGADGPIRAQVMLKGLFAQLGPCYRDENHKRIIGLIEATARELKIQELPSGAELHSAWRSAHLRYRDLRRHTATTPFVAGGCNYVSGRGSARHHEKTRPKKVEFNVPDSGH